jgi:hypothetical protein
VVAEKMSKLPNCSTKGCINNATARYISDGGTEFPVCIKHLFTHINAEVIDELRKKWSKK